MPIQKWIIRIHIDFHPCKLENCFPEPNNRALINDLTYNALLVYMYVLKFRKAILPYFVRKVAKGRKILGISSCGNKLNVISIITLMNIGIRALWLARSFALSRYNHHAVIITLKASSVQNGSQFCWCFGVGNCSIIIFSRIMINVIILKQLVASVD